MSDTIFYKVFISNTEPVNSIAGTLRIDAANGDAYLKLNTFIKIASPNIPFVSLEEVLIKQVRFDNSVQEVGQLFLDDTQGVNYIYFIFLDAFIQFVTG